MSDIRVRAILAGTALVMLAGCGGTGTAGTASAGPVVVVPTGNPTPTPDPVPTPTPTPTPTATPLPMPTPAPTAGPVGGTLNGVVAEGDSISLFSPVGYTGIYAQNHPNVVFHDDAVSGSSIASLVSRLPMVLAFKPKVVTVLIGANDLGGGQTSDEWLAALWAYVAQLKASGAQVAVGTVLPIQLGTANALYPQITANHNARRVLVNAAIRAAVGTKIDAVIDYAADADMGTDAAAADKNWYGDGTHPTELGQARMAQIYAPVVDQLLAQ